MMLLLLLVMCHFFYNILICKVHCLSLTYRHYVFLPVYLYFITVGLYFVAVYIDVYACCMEVILVSCFIVVCVRM